MLRLLFFIAASISRPKRDVPGSLRIAADVHTRIQQICLSTPIDYNTLVNAFHFLVLIASDSPDLPKTD